MPVGYYIIPMVSGPYSRENPQRPMYVDEIRCNWTGHNVDALGVYVCKVNTTDAKHADLASRAGVRALPRNVTWDTVISSLTAVQRNAISNWCNSKGIPYDSSETVGEFLMRVINSGLFGLGNAALSTQVRNLNPAQQAAIAALCEKWGVAYADTDTVWQVSNRFGRVAWPGDTLTIEEY